MGMFSWMTSDTNESISNIHSVKGGLPVKMIAPDGRTWPEEAYDGYGVFGGKDFYELLDELNGGTGDRDRGIKLYYDENIKPIQPKLVSINCKTPYDQLANSADCPDQGFFYQEDEEDEDEYDDEEDEDDYDE